MVAACCKERHTCADIASQNLKVAKKSGGMWKLSDVREQFQNTVEC